MDIKPYRDLQPGDRFHSPRAEEGIVTVLCPPGRCSHDTSRDEYGCHVAGPGGIRQQFFVNHIPGEVITLADRARCPDCDVELGYPHDIEAHERAAGWDSNP